MESKLLTRRVGVQISKAHNHILHICISVNTYGHLCTSIYQCEEKMIMCKIPPARAPISRQPALFKSALSPEMKARGYWREGRRSRRDRSIWGGGRGRRTILPLCWLIWFNPRGAAIEFPSKPFHKRIWTRGRWQAMGMIVWGEDPMMGWWQRQA